MIVLKGVNYFPLMYLSYKIFPHQPTTRPQARETIPVSDAHTGTTFTNTTTDTTIKPTINQKICFLLMIFKF